MKIIFLVSLLLIGSLSQRTTVQWEDQAQSGSQIPSGSSQNEYSQTSSWSYESGSPAPVPSSGSWVPNPSPSYSISSGSWVMPNPSPVSISPTQPISSRSWVKPNPSPVPISPSYPISSGSWVNPNPSPVPINPSNPIPSDSQVTYPSSASPSSITTTSNNEYPSTHSGEHHHGKGGSRHGEHGKHHSGKPGCKKGKKHLNSTEPIPQEIMQSVNELFMEKEAAIYKKYSDEQASVMKNTMGQVRIAELGKIEETLRKDLILLNEEKQRVAREMMGNSPMTLEGEVDEEDYDFLQNGQSKQHHKKGKCIVGFAVGFLALSTILCCCVKKCRAMRARCPMIRQQQMQQNMVPQQHNHVALQMPQYPMHPRAHYVQQPQNQAVHNQPAQNSSSHNTPIVVPQHNTQPQQQQQMIPVQLVMNNGQLQMIPINQTQISNQQPHHPHQQEIKNASPIRQNNFGGRKYPDLQEIELQEQANMPVYGTPLQNPQYHYHHYKN